MAIVSIWALKREMQETWLALQQSYFQLIQSKTYKIKISKNYIENTLKIFYFFKIFFVIVIVNENLKYQFNFLFKYV